MGQNVLNSYVVPVSTPTELAGMATNRFLNGQQALVAAMRSGAGPGLYTLQPVVSILPDNFFVVPTFDDPLRQWAYCSIQDQGIFNIFGPEIDLTAVQTAVMIPPLNFKMTTIIAVTYIITQKDGTVTTGPTAQAGTDAGITNLCPSGIQTGVAGTALNVNSTMTGGLATNNNLDLSVNGLKWQSTVGAVLGTATVFKCRLRTILNLAKF